MALFWQNLCCFSCWEGKIVEDSWLPANKSLGHWQVLKGNCQNLPLHSPLIPQSLKFSHWPSKPWHSREKTSHLLSKRLVLQKPLGIELWRILPNLPRGAVFVENPSVNRWIFSTKIVASGCLLIAPICREIPGQRRNWKFRQSAQQKI